MAILFIKFDLIKKDRPFRRSSSFVLNSTHEVVVV